MLRIARAPPVVGLALATGAGAALVHLGAHPFWALPPLVVLFRPTPSFPRPSDHFRPLAMALLAGALLTHFWASGHNEDCRFHLQEGSLLEMSGAFRGHLREGRGEFRPEKGGESVCSKPLRVVIAGPVMAGPVAAGVGEGVGPGTLFRVRGTWRRSRTTAALDPIRAGYLLVENLRVLSEGKGSRWRWNGLADRIQIRLGELFPQNAALVEALVLARKDGLTAEVRESFARAGTAHLLAISGFHVGVVGGLLLLVGGWMGLAHPSRFLLGTVGVWAYVLLIGVPDAALRAALILTTLSMGRFLSRAVVPVAALASAFVLFLWMDPGALLRPGFQLSFSGALGLILWAPQLSKGISGHKAFPSTRGLATGLAAGVSATLATLPLVIWHFGRVSLVGVPVTLLAAPLIALAIPGILFALLASYVSPFLGVFLAQGVDGVLRMLSHLVVWAGALPFASVWVSRPGLVAAVVGGAAGYLVALGRSVRPGRRVLPLAIGALSGLIVWPVADRISGAGAMELVVLDVGQGDALLVRSPRGRWLLVDVGPKTATYDAGARVVLPYLRTRGVTELALLLLTHPDMDHVGGAGALLSEFPVSAVLDPGWAVGSGVFLDALRQARDRAVPWSVAEAGDSLDLDGIALRILWPRGAGNVGSGEVGKTKKPGEVLQGLVAEEGANAVSVVVELRYGDFSALLTGDAPREVEEALLGGILSSDIQVLKVGHHGSRTSTSPELLERISPEVAAISVGGRNRYGHPHPSVLQRLKTDGVRVFRTDLGGTLTIKARRDGEFEVEMAGRAVQKRVSVDPRRR